MTEPAGFTARVNDALLYRDPTGREAWIFLQPDQVTIVTDIHQQGAPHNAVTFSKNMLLNIVSQMEGLS